MVASIAGLVTASAQLSSLAALDTSQVLSGEFWRLFSGHMAHLSWRQYFADAPAFVALYTTFSRRVTKASAILLALFASVSVSLAVIIAGIYQVYGGLSGISCAAVSAITVAMIIEQPRQLFPYFICCIFCGYLLFSGGYASGVRVAQEAHIAGSVAGVIFMLMHRNVSMIQVACSKNKDKNESL